MKINIRDLLLRRDLPIIISIIGVVFVCGLVIYTAKTKQYKNLKHKMEEQQKKNELLNEIKIINSKIDSLRKNFWEARVNASDLITNQLNKKLQEVNANSIFVSLQKEEDKVFYTLLPFKLTFSSDYKIILNFLRYIDTNPNILRIQSLQIKKAFEGVADENEGKLGVEILLDAYVLKE